VNIMQFERHAKSNAGFEETVDIVRELISEAGFGVISEIDVSGNILQSMGEVYRPYLILGACIPEHAARGLEARPDLGVLLPCNVAIHVEGDDVIVSAMEPREMLAMLGDAVVDDLAEDVGSRLEELINDIPARTTPKNVGEDSEDSWGAGNWPPELQKIIDEFRDIDDAMERYEVLYDWASECEMLPSEAWNEDNKVHGCQSEAHVACSLDEDGGFRMVGGADAQIVQGLMAITQKAINGLTPSEVADFPATFARELGFQETLTPNRANGFLNMFTKVRKEARNMLP
tara:strand:+ start:906 stop:1769 length:864 start_codon:yes stop_codon:yes gene_type:complete